jgi:fatty acid desaturase
VSSPISSISSRDIADLRRELEAAGVFRHRTAATWLKFVATLGAAVALLAAMAASPTWLALVLAPLAALPLTTAVMIGHEAGHRSFAAGPRTNELAYHLTFPLIAGIGGLHWKHKHNVLHHGHPNVIGKDTDLELWPLALTAEAHARASRPLRWFQRRLQAWAFWPITTFLTFEMRFESMRHLGRLVRAKGVTRAIVVDVACMVGHYALWFGVGAWTIGLGPTLAIYLLVFAWVGVFAAAIFAPAHMGLTVVTPPAHGWRHQLETTRNLRQPELVRWFMIGLDRQIEHHLFPSIPHQHLGRASAIVQAWCARIGAPWREIGHLEGLIDATRWLGMGWRLEPEAADAPASMAA